MLNIRDQKDFFGNKDHLNILGEALNSSNTSLWNTWRSDNKSLIPDLRGINASSDTITDHALTQIDFSYVNLEESRFNKSVLRDINFSYANLFSSSFGESTLRRCLFNDANISGSNFISTDIAECCFNNAHFTDSVLMASNIKATTFTGSNLSYSFLKHNTIEKLTCDFIYIDSTGVKRFPQKGTFSGEQIINLFSKHIHIHGSLSAKKGIEPV